MQHVLWKRSYTGFPSPTFHLVGWSVGYWGFTFWQHLRSCQVGHRLVTVHTHGDFIIYPTGKSGGWHHETQYPTQIHYYPDTELTLLMLSASLGSDRYNLYKSLVWRDQELNSRSPARESRALPIRLLYPMWQHLSSYQDRYSLWKRFHRWFPPSVISSSSSARFVDKGLILVIDNFHYQPALWWQW